jgi:putative FmdB family regulatory protein
MPLYEYECDACGRRFELIRRFSDPPADTCAVCGAGPVRKLFSSPAIQFKGSGFYITDYPKKDQKAGAKGELGEKGAKGEKGDKTEGVGSDTASAKDKANRKDQGAKGKEAKGDKASGGSSGDKAAPSAATSSGSNKAKSPSE